MDRPSRSKALVVLWNPYVNILSSLVVSAAFTDYGLR